MQQIKDVAIVLKRMNYGEADRIITLITKEHGKISLLAKGVRKSTSKLAGGIELFAESYIQYIPSKNGLGTLTSTRIKQNFGHITNNLDFINSAYEMLNVINGIAEHTNEKIFYDELLSGLSELDKATSSDLLLCHFYVRLLNLTGHTLNTSRDINGDNFNEKSQYLYNFNAGAFEPVCVGHPSGVVKLIKLMNSLNTKSIQRITGADTEAKITISVLRTISEYYLNIKTLKIN